MRYSQVFTPLTRVFCLPIISLCHLKQSFAEKATKDNKVEKIYRLNEIKEHNTMDKKVWVTYKDGVYDITKFIANHPGGSDKIMLAAGGSVEPFWRVYQQHYNSKLPIEMLHKMRIGTLHPDDLVTEVKTDENDPYRTDPTASPILLFHSKKPINAEPPETLIQQSWITPNDLWFIRNHHPIPILSEDNYTLTVIIPAEYTLTRQAVNKQYTLQELKNKFKLNNVISSIQCGGNRRHEMNLVPGKSKSILYRICIYTS